MDVDIIKETGGLVMNKKKVVSLVLASILFTGTASNVFADGKMVLPKQIKVDMKITDEIETMAVIKKDEANKIAKKFLKDNMGITITDDYKFYSNQDGGFGKEEAVWNINFVKDSENDRDEVRIAVGAVTGKVLSFNRYSGGHSNELAEVSYSQAQEIAINGLKKIFPDEMKQVRIPEIKISKSGYSGQYFFSFNRENQGIEFGGNYLSARVDGTTGEIVGFNIQWDKDLKFPNVKDAMKVDKAEEILLGSIDINEEYKLYRNKYRFQEDENRKNIKLVYDINTSKGSGIDAVTGEFLWENTDSDLKKVSLTESEIKELQKKYEKVEKLKSEMTEADAIKIAQEKVKKHFGEGFEAINTNYYEDSYKDVDTWRVNFLKKESSKEGEDKIEISTDVEIVLDSETGRLVSANKYSRKTVNGNYVYFNDESDDFKAKVTWEEGYKLAVDFLGEEFKDKLKNLGYEMTRTVYTNRKGIVDDRPQKYYSYNFNRVENGKAFESNSISITVDAEDGTVSRVYENWFEDCEFVSPEKAIGEKKIKGILEEKYQPVLKFVEDDEVVRLVYDYKGTKSVYNFNDMDAFDGSLLDYSGEVIIENTKEFLSEIKGSKYEKELEILGFNGLMDIRDFKLNETVTKRDLIKGIVDAFGYRTYEVAEERLESKMMLDSSAKEDNSGEYDLTDEDYIKMAKYYGIVDDEVSEKELDSNVTKIDMVKAMIKFTGYGDIADMSDIFKVDSKDAGNIEKEDIGYAALALGFEIAKIEDGSFEPAKEMKNEDMFGALFYAVKNKKNTGGYYPMPRIYEK